MNTRDLMDAQNKSVDAFAIDMAMVIKKHLNQGTLKVGNSGRFYEDQPTRESLTKEKNEDHFTIMYPPKGGVQSSTGSNVVTVDFWEGTVRHDNDNKASSNLSKSLQDTGKSAIFVLFVRVNKACKIRLDNMGERTIAGDFKIRGMPIRNIVLSSVDGSSFDYSILASTNSKTDFDDQSEFSPIVLATIHNTVIGAGSIIVTTGDVIPVNAPGIVRAQIGVATSGSVSVWMTKDGNTQKVSLNSGNGLRASSLYEFDILINPGYTYNFSNSVRGTVQSLIVQEIQKE